MRVLTLNPGSSSLKAAMVADGTAVGRSAWETKSSTVDEQVVADALGRWREVEAVAVRFVHGGSRGEPVLVDDELFDALERLGRLAPLHQPQSVALTRAVRRACPAIPVVACFDTSFHVELPAAAAHYPLAREWTRQGRLRRYGFHGLSCQYVARRAVEMLGLDPGVARLVCCHLGAGVSVTAIHGGRSVDTSMGFTPLEGPAMATRSGSIDPGLLLHVMETASMSPAGMADALYRHSGLAGMSGTSGDLREVRAAASAGEPDAVLALAVYLHRLRREIGAVAMSLPGLDAIVFTGGVAEYQPDLVATLAEGLGLLGVEVDEGRCAADGDRVVSPDHAAVTALILRAREDLELARGAEQVLAPARVR
ncbi:acetate/propionate family kinase [Amycolatopsis sp. NPDC059021]|uniref:acetate/propionate family kinase n=1 Tax=Amycolatopsis sp. NPDC059021 TaxID=3346704 RepID=UPI00367234FF